VISAQKSSGVSGSGVTRRRAVTKYLRDMVMCAALILLLRAGLLQWAQVRGYFPDIGMALAIALLLSTIWAAPHVLRWVSNDKKDKKEEDSTGEF
jgi:hypothetical protein